MNTTTRPTLIERIRDAKLRRDDKGLALLDVLIGMAIFALIVIIAIQSISQFRQRAYQTAASSDAQQVSVAIEGALTDTQTLPADAAAVMALDGVNMTKNVTVAAYNKNANGSDYTLCAAHKTGTKIDGWASYDSTKGAIVNSGRGTPAATGVGACSGLS